MKEEKEKNYGESWDTSSVASGKEANVGKSLVFVKFGKEGIIGQGTVQILSLNRDKSQKA
jgi:hypothetical protein